MDKVQGRTPSVDYRRMPQGTHHHPSSRGGTTNRQPFHEPHTSLGATGHWIKEAGILAPLVIGEFVKDEGKKWRYIRMASVATALLSEGMWAAKIHAEREKMREHWATEHKQAR
jgi:hypothetical protein